MTERNVSGDAVRSRFKAAQKRAAELELSAEDMDLIADGAREFDAQRAPDARAAKALEKIALNTQPERNRENSWEWEERRLRKREVYAQELLAVATIGSDEEIDAVGKSPAFKRLVERLKGEPNASVPDSATP